MRGDYDRPKNRSYVQNRRTVHGAMSRAGHITARDSNRPYPQTHRWKPSRAEAIGLTAITESR